MTWNNLLPALRDPRVQTPSPELPQTTAALLARITDPYGVYCVLELQMGGSDSIFHLFPVMPESLAVTQRYLQTITPTQGGVFIDDYGRAPSPVVLTGTFGRSPKLDIATGQEALVYNADRFNARLANLVNTTDFSSAYADSRQPVTGYKLVKLLSEMVDLSHVPDPKTGQLPKAIFYNFGFGQFYEVALTGFQAQMDVERNGIWYYQLEMVMLKRINDGLTDSMPGLVLGAEPSAIYRRSQQLAADRLKQLEQATQPAAQQVERRAGAARRLSERLRLQTALDTVQRGRELINRAEGFISPLRAVDVLAYGSAVLDRTLGLTPGSVLRFYDTVRTMPMILNQVESILVQTTRRLPNELRDELRLAKNSITQILPRVEQYIESVNLQQAALGSTTTAAQSGAELYPPSMPAVVALSESVLLVSEMLDSVQVLFEMYGFADVPSNSSSDVFSTLPVDVMGPGSTTYIIRQGDTLLNIAQREYGDENAWTLVAGALPSPYASLASTESLNALVGTPIQLPAVNTGATPLVPYVWTAPNGADALGRDLPDELRTMTRADGSTELVVLSEFETLLQGLIHRLQTPIGGIPDDQTFGSSIPAFIGQDFGSLTGAMNEAKVAEALRKDPRLTTVDRVTATQNQDTLEIGFSATARNAGSLGYVSLSLSRQTP